MKQHYIPQCYLREFLNSDRKLHTLDTALKKHGKKVFDEPRFPTEVCRSKDFYTIQTTFSKNYKHLSTLKPFALEESFHQYERDYPKLVIKLKAKQKALIKKDASSLIYSLVDMKLRNKYFRDTIVPSAHEKVINETLSELRENVSSIDLSQFPQITPQAISNTILKIQQQFTPSDEIHKQGHISSLMLRKQQGNEIHEKIIQQLFKLQWKVMIAKNNSFITNDNPGVCYQSNGYIQNTKFDQDFTYIVPISPQLCLWISDAEPDTKWIKNNAQKAIEYIELNKDSVSKINQLSLKHYNRFIFSNNKSVIDQIAEVVNRVQ
ncbi:DUF4238 domain-containing protein [Pedobacter sp. HDW13]|uniref:DUF4238 domain-containing protein n=1 Tax=Pedobacter sp. HDW13 TaxID=2714940 RepID=UPI00140E60EB|nr:DUF4238 domain-containing protein [Pedobacter sp. HDW13]QIL42390.1 DUF4238 domain-containing protein [Pedobacter sp. HDW13]